MRLNNDGKWEGRGKTLANFFLRGLRVVCRDGSLEDAAYLGLQYGMLYEVAESARSVEGERLVCVRDRLGRETCARIQRFRPSGGMPMLGDDGPLVSISEEYSKPVSDTIRATIEAEERFLGAMVRRGCPHWEVFHFFLRSGQKNTSFWKSR